jgi:hypothetical protein
MILRSDFGTRLEFRVSCVRYGFVMFLIWFGLWFRCGFGYDLDRF